MRNHDPRRRGGWIVVMAGKVGFSSLLPSSGSESMAYMRTRNVLIVLFDGVQSLAVTGPLEVFSGANGCLAVHGDPAAYEITTASIGARTIRTSSGLTIT